MPRGENTSENGRLGRDKERETLEEDVTFFTMLAEVEPLNLVALGHAQSHDRVEHLEKDKRADNGK